jgi:hypothetical protein
VAGVLAACGQGVSDTQFVKGRFIGEMYARGCYSILLVSASGPAALRVPLRAGGLLPLPRSLAVRLGSTLLTGMDRLLPCAVPRQLLLISAVMGMLDVVLDCVASDGMAAALRVASLLARPIPSELHPPERMIVSLVTAAREGETLWQEQYWQRVLEPAVNEYCKAEVLGANQIADPTGMGHREAGIEAVIKGMWYVAGPLIGLRGDPPRFERKQWNREQCWMAEATMLMQMIDDWVDQDEDRGARLTPVIAGDWTLDSTAGLYEKTTRDLNALLDESGIQKPVFRALLMDLYQDYLHTAIDAMSRGVAA